MNWPRSHEEMGAAGYIYSGESTCRACRARILFYRTPNGGKIPINPKDFTTHFATCSAAKDFRKVKPRKKERPRLQGDLF